MTLKEQAKELVNEYWNNIPDLFFEEAKQCALIAIKFAKNSEYKYFASSGLWIDGTAHFEKIEQEIEKL